MTPSSLVELSRLSFRDIGHIQTEVGALELQHDRSVAVLRHDDVAKALTSPDLTVNHRFRTTLRLFGSTILDIDGSDHCRQRAPVVRGLVDGKAELFDADKITEIAASVVASLRGRETTELIENLAVRVVTGVMANLTGLSPGESLHLYTLYRPVVRVLAGDASAFEEAKANLHAALEVYVNRNRSATKHAAPFTRALNNAVMEKRLSEPELNRHHLMIFLAGTETTVCAISNALWMLAIDKNLLPRLRELNPGQIDTAVAEFLRYQPPLFSTVRFAVRPHRICGVAVKARTPVHLCLAAACRDPDKFPEPHRLDLARAGSTALMFGQGDHFCPGAAIAKQEVKAVLRALMSQVDDVRLLDDLSPPIEGNTFRLPRSLNASISWAA